jgi:hypothetical protein
VASDWQERANELSARAIAHGTPSEWFEQLWSEGEAGAVEVPWPRDEPHPLLASWVRDRAIDGWVPTPSCSARWASPPSASTSRRRRSGWPPSATGDPG